MDNAQRSAKDFAGHTAERSGRDRSGRDRSGRDRSGHARSGRARPGRARPGRKPEKQDDPLQGILETLYSEHRYIGSLLDALEEQAERLAPGKIPDFHLLLDMVDYLSHFPDQYHHPREDLLFNGMLESDRAFEANRTRLAREHRTLHHYSLELFEELTQIARGRPVDRPALANRIERYISGYRQHIDFENREIFPNARGTLDATDLKKLSKNTRYIDDPLFGREIQYQYRRLGRNLEASVELAGQQLISRELSGIQSMIGGLSTLVDSATRFNSAITGRNKRAWQENIDTVREHVRYGQGPSVFRLPLALLDNHQRHLAAMFKDVRTALRDRNADNRAPPSD